MKDKNTKLCFLFVLLLFSIEAKTQNYKDLQEIANKRNLLRKCQINVYLSVPTRDRTWLFAPSVKEMKAGLVARRLGKSSSYNVIFLTKDGECEKNINDYLDGGADGYIEIKVSNKTASGGISRDGINKIIRDFGG